MNDQTLAPYRQQAAVELYEETKKPKYGLIVAPLPPVTKPHQCKLPNPVFKFVAYILHRFRINTLKNGDMWRCPECEQCYEFEYYKSYSKHKSKPTKCDHLCCFFVCSYWVQAYSQDWVNKGGQW